MEAILIESISPYKKSQTRNPRNFKLQKTKYHHPLSPSENFFNTTGLLHAPSTAFFSHSSYPPSQPPLLPLPPRSNLRRSGGGVRGQSCPPVNKESGNGGRTRDPSLLSPRKSNKHSSPQKSPVKAHSTTVSSITRSLPLSSYSSSADTCKNLIRFESKVDEGGKTNNNGKAFSGSVAFTVSPPPSSLPLPTFSLRPKQSCCNVEAAGINAGATDDLRRLLRIR